MYQKLHKVEQWVFDILSMGLLLFYCYSAVLAPAATQYHRGIYLLITYVLVFMLYKNKTKIGRVVDYLLMATSIVTIGYWMLNFEAINYRTGIETELDTYIAMVGVLIGIELARRVVGNVFLIIGGIMLLYGMQGYDYLFSIGGYGIPIPEVISHAGDTFPGLCVTIFYKSDGVFGIMANVLATYIILFVLFGAFLEKCGAQKFFIDFPLAAVGHKMGGPAKVAVIASGLFGSISGSAIANTVSTGAFTIPMMKKAGFKPHIAGAIEPAASIGGMFMPPIMGAGGFIMAEMTGLPYSRIMLIAIFPAIMYFFSVFVMVHFEAKKNNLVGERSEHNAMDILKREWHYTLPLVTITIFMVSGFSPGFSAVVGLLTCIIISWKVLKKWWHYLLPMIPIGLFYGLTKVTPLEITANNIVIFSMLGMILYSWFRKDTKLGPREFLKAAREGTEQSLKIGATAGVIGIIIGVLTYSGLVLTFADIVIDLAASVSDSVNVQLFFTILLIALASLVLGMGVPVTAAYLITAVVAVPALTHLGVNEVASHMIVYWLSQDSNITPPVCIAAFAGATIAKANMWRTAFAAFKFAKFLYLGPFLFGYVPEFSLNGSSWDIFKVFVLIIIGTYGYSWFLSGIWVQDLKRYFGKAKQPAA